MLGIVGLRHVIIDFSACAFRYVCGRVGALGHVLFEEWIDLTAEGLTVQSALHVSYSIIYFNEIYFFVG